VSALLKYDAARQAVAEAKTFDEVRDWENKAAAFQEYSRRARDREMELDCLTIREDARRRRGELLLDMKARGELVPGDHEVVDQVPRKETLKSLGISKNESARDQRIALLSEDAYQRLVARCRAYAAEHETHTFEMMKVEEKEAERARRASEHAAKIYFGGKVTDLEKLKIQGCKFGAILADPPWHFITRSDTRQDRGAQNHYTTDKTWQETLNLPVKELAAPDCILFMWMVDWAPKLALEVMEAWGFTHKTTAFTWAKRTKSDETWHMGQGYWTRANPEQCWLATKGHPKRINADVRQLVVAPVTEHSRKPDEIHGRIERLVGGPYLELYARRDRANWTTWGNELAFVMPPHDPETGEIIEQAAE
jgi:N6-adenosine-specific RNA methylase IME4